MFTDIESTYFRAFRHKGTYFSIISGFGFSMHLLIHEHSVFSEYSRIATLIQRLSSFLQLDHSLLVHGSPFFSYIDSNS